MKNPTILVVLALLVGIGIGWVVKPGAPAGGDESAAGGEMEAKVLRPREDRPEVAERKADEEREPTAKVQTMMIGGEGTTSEEVRKMQEKMAESMNKRQSMKDDKRIAELVEKLGLDPAQEAKLRAHFDKKRTAMAGMFSGDASAMDPELMKPGKLDEILAEVLSDEQKDAYEELKTVERERKIESQALRDLAKLNQAIDLRPDQKDAVYDILYEDAGAKVDSSGNMEGIVGAIGDGFGMDISIGDGGLLAMDSATVGAVAVDGEVAGEGTPDSDMQAMAERMKAQRQEKMDEKVERLKPVLDEKQLGDYREHLESQGSMFESFVIPSLGE